MKTILGTMALAAGVAALAACHHDETPTRTPAQETTSTASYTQSQGTYMQSPPQESASSTYNQDPALNGAQSTTGSTGTTASNDGIIRPSPATPPLDPSLEPGASPKPVTGTAPTEPGPANAKQDKKSPNAAAATDQGNKKSEVQISARIRKTVMASDSLTFGAKNAKIITQGSKVTLRGNVKTQAEKTEIVGIARNTDGVTEVDDQLVVKP